MSTIKLIVGNWKMNGLSAESRERALRLAGLAKMEQTAPFEMVLCPPAAMIFAVAENLKESSIQWGGQDCHTESAGAFTGDTAATMLKDLGCSFVIVGHSERRQFHKETNGEVAAKAKAAHAAGLTAIICVGETDVERMAGKADEVVREQLSISIPDTSVVENTVIAYEPVWAIGTGKTASADDIKHMHELIRQRLVEKFKTNSEDVRILYGGSVKQSNAAEILRLPNVDGVLVGGASLKAEEFWAIAVASRKENQ